MNAPVLRDAALTGSLATVTAWRRVAVPLALGLLLLGLLFNREVVAAVQTWNVSTAYNHCFLIIPIALYLIWDRRFDLDGIPPRPMPMAVLLGLPLAVVWLIAERLGMMEGRQLVAVTFVEVLFLAMLGTRLWWALAGPLLYLYFLVPFGEFLTPKLQDITTWFIRHGLEILGVPAYIDGYIIEIPQGTFFVAEACAGLRFLIASIAFGCLYALMMYRSPLRRGVFILVSIVVPIIANGFRGLGIVYLGYLLNSAQAAAADHVIYGWVFFSAVILLLIVLGLPFRQDDVSTRSAVPPRPVHGSPASLRGGLAVAFAMVAIAAISPTVAAGLTMVTDRAGFAASSIDLGPGCTVQPMRQPGVTAGAERVTCGGVPMDIAWEVFSPRITAAPLMAARRRMVARVESEGLQESWFQAAGNASSAWRVMMSADPPFAIAVSMWVDGQAVRPGLAVRARMAMNSLFGSAFTPIVVTITPAVDWASLSQAGRKEAVETLPDFLRAHGDLDRIVGALSTR